MQFVCRKCLEFYRGLQGGVVLHEQLPLQPTRSNGLSERVDIRSDTCMPDTVISPLAQETRESTVQPSKDVNIFSLRQKATSTKNFFFVNIPLFWAAWTWPMECSRHWKACLKHKQSGARQGPCFYTLFNCTHSTGKCMVRLPKGRWYLLEK